MKVYVVQETFTDMYAGYCHGEWFKDPLRAMRFAKREQANEYAKRIKSGPRQFAGLGQESRVVCIEVK